MFRRIRGPMRRQEREPDPLVKVAGVTTRQEAERCLETLRGRGIETELREDAMGAYDLWVHASVEALARFLLGLSGRSVIRVPRPKREEGETGTGDHA